MTDDFVTYDQAIKLKELGFDWDCSNNDIKYTPTLTQAQKWLREVKGVKVYVKPLFSSEKYEYWISFKFQGFMVGDERYGVEETWEYALSAGINEAIKLLKREEQRNTRWYEK